MEEGGYLKLFEEFNNTKYKGIYKNILNTNPRTIYKNKNINKYKHTNTLSRQKK